MSESVQDLATPCILVDLDRLEANIAALQRLCSGHHTRLWPHIKTHKMTEVARRQLAAGAEGLSCAKLGEAEAILPSGVRRIFVAHSLVDRRQASRLRVLHDALDELVLAATSLAQAQALKDVLRKAGISTPVMMAVDTGLDREGVRSLSEAQALHAFLRAEPEFELRGLYTHEGFAYTTPASGIPALAEQVYRTLLEYRDALDPRLELWPGCSVTARHMAAFPEVAVIRPGAYVFGDLFLSEVTGAMPAEETALTVLSRVVDLPREGLALIDAGSKSLGSDRTTEGVIALPLAHPALSVGRCNEEHGYLTGPSVGDLRIGEMFRLTPAHVCPVLNLTDEVVVVRGDTVLARWRVEARGKVS